MKIYFFAVASEDKPASVVYEADDVIQSEIAIEAIIRDGYDMQNIRAVTEDDARRVNFMMKVKDQIHGSIA